MRQLAVKSLILTGVQCLTAYRSHPVSKLTTDWIHAHKRTNFADDGLNKDEDV